MLILTLTVTLTVTVTLTLTLTLTLIGVGACYIKDKTRTLHRSLRSSFQTSSVVVAWAIAIARPWNHGA